MKFENFLVHKNDTIESALNLINLNKHGTILIVDDNSSVIGIATDGDIRRKLVQNVSLNDSINLCANYTFINAKEDTPREILLKQLDHGIKVIPILDINYKLISIISKDYFPDEKQQKVYARSKSPVRVSFGGGGSDISTYFTDNKAAVINATISLYSHCTLKVRDDEKIIINSLDLDDKIEFENLDLLLKYTGKFSLIQSVIKAIRPTFGFELYLHSDFPMSSGLGGSAVVTASILGCFNQFRFDKWDKHDISEIAFPPPPLSSKVGANP